MNHAAQLIVAVGTVCLYRLRVTAHAVELSGLHWRRWGLFEMLSVPFPLKHVNRTFSPGS